MSFKKKIDSKLSSSNNYYFTDNKYKLRINKLLSINILKQKYLKIEYTNYIKLHKMYFLLYPPSLWATLIRHNKK